MGYRIHYQKLPQQCEQFNVPPTITWLVEINYVQVMGSFIIMYPYISISLSEFQWNGYFVAISSYSSSPSSSQIHTPPFVFRSLSSPRGFWVASIPLHSTGPPVPASIRISKTFESCVLWLRNLILSSSHSDLTWSDMKPLLRGYFVSKDPTKK